MHWYAIYSLLIAASFGHWALLFWFMRKNSGATRNAVGWLMIGPFHSYLEKRGYYLSKRELLGWGLVGTLMLLAPAISWLLER
jgi:hypothetical protein